MLNSSSCGWLLDPGGGGGAPTAPHHLNRAVQWLLTGGEPCDCHAVRLPIIIQLSLVDPGLLALRHPPWRNGILF